MRKKILFYDTNCFTVVPRECLKALIDCSHNCILSPVLKELRAGNSLSSDKSSFDLVLSPDGILNKPFTEISLEPCRKNRNINLKNKSLIYLKENPVSCSSYFTWLVSAVNPAIITDFYRHTFNELFYELRNKPNDLSKIFNLESKFRVKEKEQIDSLLKEQGRNPIIKSHWVLKARKKRFDDIKNHKFKLTDYQLITAAIVSACLNEKSTGVLSCDRDCLDITENLIRSVIERFSTMQLLQERFDNLDENSLNLYRQNFIDFKLTFDEVNKSVLNTFNKIAQDKHFFTFNLMLYKSDQELYFPYEFKIPIWLSDFILEFKKTLDCYSIDSVMDMKYNFKYKFQPDFVTGEIIFRVFPRTLPNLIAIWSDCEAYCKYSKQELTDPTSLSEFILKL